MAYEIISRTEKNKYNISVIVPVYNVEDYITETLESILRQTISGIEIILIDDGSTDNSEKLIKDYLKYNTDIVYIKQENSGPGEARNTGIELARGQYISFVDSDDILPDDALETMYRSAKEEQADIVTGASLSFNSKKAWYIASHVNRGVYEPGTKNLLSNPELLYSVGPCNKLFSTSIIKNIRFPKNINVTEDHPFVIEAYLKANKIFTVDKVIYNYRRREDEENVSLSQSVRVNALSVLQDIMKSMSISDNLWDYYIDNPVAREATKASYYNRIVSSDIWPSLINVIKNKDATSQFKAFTILSKWLSSMESSLFNKIIPLHRVFTYELAKRFSMIAPKAHKPYLRCVTACLKIMDPGSLHRLEITKFNKEVRTVKRAYEKQSIWPLKNYVFWHRIAKISKITKRFLKNGAIRRILYPIFRKLPVKKKIIFASNKLTNLGDSFKYIYDELLLQRNDYEIIGYFRKRRNLREFCRYYYDMATAKYIILDDYYRPLYNLSFRKETEIIQLWHAAGAFKKFGHSAIGSIDSNSAEFEKRAHGAYTKVIVTGKEIVPHYAQAFGIPQKNVLPLGLARTDAFYNKSLMEFIDGKYKSAYPQLKDKKVITYAPTFRGGPKDRSVFTLQLDLDLLEKRLSSEYVLILKLHPSVTKQLKIPQHLKDFVINMSKNDMNNVLSITDILITDYSSIIFEYALLNRPMIFFAYDLHQYLSERGFYYEYENFVPGPIVNSTEKLIQQITENKFDISKIETFKEKFFDHFDGHSAKRFVENIIKP